MHCTVQLTCVRGRGGLPGTPDQQAPKTQGGNGGGVLGRCWRASLPQPVDLDPHTFRRDYMARLANLTVNCLLIIEGLWLGAMSHEED